MNWTELLKDEVEYTYRVTEGLLKLVEDDRLDWRPPIGSNWMTTGQLLRHLGESCGAPCKGFVTGDWRSSETGEAAGDALPSAESMPAVRTVAEARQLLVKDRQLALDMLARCSEERLSTEMSTAPWDQTGMVLGRRLLQMVAHLNQHKGQLFYYLKMQGKPVDSSNLWGG